MFTLLLLAASMNCGLLDMGRYPTPTLPYHHQGKSMQDALYPFCQFCIVSSTPLGSASSHRIARATRVYLHLNTRLILPEWPLSLSRRLTRTLRVWVSCPICI